MDSGMFAGQIVIMVTATAAAFATVYARLGHSKKEFKRMEERTAAIWTRVTRMEAHIKRVDEKLKDQIIRETTETAVRTMSISVSGRQEYSDPLQLIFVLKEPKAKLTSIELRNEADSFFGSVRCTTTAPCTFNASVETLVIQQWFRGGVEESGEVRRVVIRVQILFQSREAQRDMTVYLRNAPQVIKGVGSTHLFRLYDHSNWPGDGPGRWSTHQQTVTHSRS